MCSVYVVHFSDFTFAFLDFTFALLDWYCFTYTIVQCIGLALYCQLGCYQLLTNEDCDD